MDRKLKLLSALVLSVFITMVGMQCLFLSKLQRSSEAMTREAMRNVITATTSSTDAFFRGLIDYSTDLRNSTFTNSRVHPQKDLRASTHSAIEGGKLFFFIDFPQERDFSLHLYDSTGLPLQESPETPEVQAIIAASSGLLYLQRTHIATTQRITEHPRDPKNRIFLYPITDRNSEISSIVGVIVDMRYFNTKYLPALVERNIARLFPNDQEHLAASVYDGSNNLIFATRSSLPNSISVSGAWPFLLNDHHMIVRGDAVPASLWAQRSFVVTVVLTLLITCVMAAAIALMMRTVSQSLTLSRMKTEFVANVSHELQTPLASMRVLGELERLGRVNDPGRVREFGDRIERECLRLSNLVSKILDLSRIESGSKSFHVCESDIAELVQEAVRDFELIARESGFVVTYDARAQCPPVMVDRDAIQEVLSNILENALKYSTTEKTIAVRVTADDGFVNVSVVDKGIGIARDEQPKIFDKFYRIGNNLAHNVPGCGLGLAISSHIVKAHRGKLTVISEPGRGSTFSICLPTKVV